MTTPNEVQPKVYSHINGTLEETIDRLQVAELCKGWPVYRDASEWNNFRDLFTDDAYVWTTWSGGVTIDQFIAVSKAGKAKGDFIMHRENGTLVDLNPKTRRAVGKMKTTITQRFTLPATTPGETCQADVECDNRFIFFCQKLDSGEWKCKYYKVFYEKDRVVPVDPAKPPASFDEAELAKYPEGYRYLAVAQNAIGHRIANLPTLRNSQFEKMYEAMGQWLDGKDINLNFD
ncbi:hypothetical protein FISHEDRAFT_65982 [Fistulina hepatica ATCC 64428]|uniref:SnoaL-like domain-containing protein n=1 Tax=Fistulina hepatica ATCC 64428 TaxID=1128425 RepID=A0A0D7AAM1_9AGAR|nr:hypothetical protein FISHEDRAFT_65982 [Fistulina hepatica ATCC 64428]